MSTDDPLNSADAANTAEAASRRKAIEAQLAGLRPTAATVDRDRLMFAAGRAAAAQPRWSHAASLVAAACAALMVGRWTAPSLSPLDPQPSPLAQRNIAPAILDVAQSTDLRDPASLLQLRLHYDELDVHRGPSSPSVPAAVSPRALMRELLN